MWRELGVLVLLSCLPAQSQDKEFEKNLRQRLEGQLFLLSGTNLSNGLEYDREGKPLKPLKADEWVDWTERECHVDHVKVSADNVNVDCEFFSMSYGEVQQEFHPMRIGGYHDSWIAWGKIKISRSPGDKDLDVLHALDRVLVTTADRFNSELPYYWQPFFSLPKEMRNGYLSKMMEQTKEDVAKLRTSGKLLPASASGRMVEFAGVVPFGRVNYRLGGRPLALHDERKGAVYFVIDDQGKVRDYQVVRPVGLGFERWIEQEFIKTRYKPAQLDGKPVAVPVLLTYSLAYY